MVEIYQQDPDLGASPAAERGFARRQLVPPTVIEQPGQGVGHRTQLELGVELCVAPGSSGYVTEEGTALEVFLGELGQTVSPHVDDAEPVVSRHERHDEQGLL